MGSYLHFIGGKNMGYRIGLDIGITSVGWSVIEDDSNGNPIRIIDLGSIFWFFCSIKNS